MNARAHVLRALAGVYDPELDEPITTLRFVGACEVTSDGDVEVTLRLPTPQCAPNFAYLMAADARAAVRRLPGIRSVRVVLQDHYTGDEINAAVAAGRSFAEAFPGETEADRLDALRAVFQRKALVARQSELCERLLAAGETLEALTARTVADLPDDPVAARCLELRAELGFGIAPGDPAFVLADGRALPIAELERWRRMARLVRTSLQANGGICRSLLQSRHALSDPQEVAR